MLEPPADLSIETLCACLHTDYNLAGCAPVFRVDQRGRVVSTGSAGCQPAGRRGRAVCHAHTAAATGGRLAAGAPSAYASSARNFGAHPISP